MVIARVCVCVCVLVLEQGERACKKSAEQSVYEKKMRLVCLSLLQKLFGGIAREKERFSRTRQSGHSKPPFATNLSKRSREKSPKGQSLSRRYLKHSRRFSFPKNVKRMRSTTVLIEDEVQRAFASSCKYLRHSRSPFPAARAHASSLTGHPFATQYFAISRLP